MVTYHVLLLSLSIALNALSVLVVISLHHSKEKAPLNHVERGFLLEPSIGLEPTTYSLRMNCSTN